MKVLVWIIFTFLTQSAFNQSFKNLIEKEFDKIRNNNFTLLYDADLLKLDNRLLIDSLQYLHNDTSVHVRYNLQNLEYKIALNNIKDTVITYKVVFQLIKNLSDNETNIAISALSKLLSFQSNSFNVQSVKLFNLDFQKFPQTKNLYLLIGKLKWIHHRKYIIEQVNNNPAITLSDFNSANWGMQLALAMMGYEENINYCLKQISSCNDPIIKYTVLFNDVKYLKNKSSIQLLRKELENKDIMPSTSHYIKGRNCNFYALDILTEILVNFPIANKKRVYSANELQTAMNWLDNAIVYQYK